MQTPVKILYIACLLLLTGCTVQEKSWEKVSPVFIKEEAKKHIDSTKLVISIDQDKRLGIPVLGQRTSHQYFGVVGKLAESGLLRFENSLSEKQRNLLRGVDKAAFRFDTGSKFRDTLENNLHSLAWLKVSSVVNETNLHIPDIEAMVKTMDEDAMLLIDNRYLMAIDFSSITVFSYATLYAHDENLVKIAKSAKPYEDPPTLYKNLFSNFFNFGAFMNLYSFFCNDFA